MVAYGTADTEEELASLIGDLDHLAAEVSYYVVDPPGVRKLRREKIAGTVKFTEPVPVSTLVAVDTYSYNSATFASLGMALISLDFPPYYNSMSIFTFLVEGEKRGLTLPTYTHAVALLLKPEVRSAVESGEVEFSGRGVEEFVTSAIECSVKVMRSRPYRAVKVEDVFEPCKSGVYYAYIVEAEPRGNPWNAIAFAVLGYTMGGWGVYRMRLLDRYVMFSPEDLFGDSVVVGVKHPSQGFELGRGWRRGSIRRAFEELRVLERLRGLYPTFRREALQTLELLKAAKLGLALYTM